MAGGELYPDRTVEPRTVLRRRALQVIQPFPGRDSGKDVDAVPNTSSTVTSRRRILMKHVQSARADNGTIAIASIRSDIKLDKLTTSVFADNELFPAK